MTTKIHSRYALNLLEENDVYCLDKSSMPDNEIIGGIVWEAIGENHNTKKETVLKLIFNIVINKLDNFNIWLLIGDSYWQDDNKIVRYKKQLSSYKFHGIALDSNIESNVILLQKERVTKFFCAKKLTPFCLGNVINAIFEESNAYILALPNNISITPTLHRGWQNDNDFDKELISYIVENDGLLLKSFGECDDIEAGFTGICKPELVKKLL